MLTQDHENALMFFCEIFQKTGATVFEYVFIRSQGFWKNLETPKVVAILEHLDSEGFLEINYLFDGTVLQRIYLTPTGKNYFEQKRLSVEAMTLQNAELKARERKEIKWRAIPIIIAALSLVRASWPDIMRAWHVLARVLKSWLPE